MFQGNFPGDNTLGSRIPGGNSFGRFSNGGNTPRESSRGHFEHFKILIFGNGVAVPFMLFML